MLQLSQVPPLLPFKIALAKSGQDIFDLANGHDDVGVQSVIGFSAGRSW